MRLLHVTLAVVVAVSAATTLTPHPAVNESTPLIPSDDRSTLGDILRGLGISDTCVASAIDQCVAVPKERQVVTLLREAHDLLQDTRHLLEDASQNVNKKRTLPRHCKDVLDFGDGGNGVRVIYPYPGQPERSLRVYCDQTTDGRGWTIFQRRKESTERENFYRVFQEYVEGFGNLEEEFWLGLDALYALTSTEPQELRIDLGDWEGGHRYAKYGSFLVDGPSEKYRLTVEEYSGTANDSFTFHSGQKFSTHDSDNDSWSEGNCAEQWHGAWWYKNCYHSNLNGYQYENNPTDDHKGITWNYWRGDKYSLRRTTMMLRPTTRIGG